MIQLMEIKKEYHTYSGPLKAVDSVSVKIEQGKIFGFIGFSGAGKSTLLRCINMLEKPDSGTVLVDGEDFTTLAKKDILKRRRKIGMIFQHFNLISNSTVFENVAFPLEISAVPKSEIRKRVLDSLGTVDLAEKANDYPAKLSGGQKQRVAIARAIVINPKILLCDEPTSALDPQNTASILRYLKLVNKNLGITIVIVTHEMEAARLICDEVAVMEKGVVVEKFNMADASFHPQSEIAKYLFNHGAGI